VISDGGALPELAGADAGIVNQLGVEEIAVAIVNAVNARYDQSKVKERIQHARRFRWEDSAQKTRDVLLTALQQDQDVHI
jgi:cell division protein ZapA (FtsZ GTPase activity inhibitor)